MNIQNQESIVVGTTIDKQTLTNSQKQKFAVLQGIFLDEDITLRLVSLLDSRGENSYATVHSKIQAIMQADYLTQQYHDALIDNFEINATYKEDEIMSIVGTIRRDLKLSQYLTGIKKNSLRDIFSIFIIGKVDIEEQSSSEDSTELKKRITGYIPLFKLKPDDE